MRLLFSLCIAGIIYGSLYPFTFVAGGHGVTLTDVLNVWDEVPSRGDVFGNLFLFVPFGLLGAFVMARRPLVMWGLLLSTVVQIAQFWVAFRAPQIQDIFCNGLGMAAGILIAAVPGVENAFRNADKSRWLSPSALLIGVFFLSVAVPFVPSIDYAAFKNSLKPLLKSPVFEPMVTFQVMVIWLGVACLLDGLWRERNRQRLALIALMALAFFLQIIIVRNQITLADALGAITALALWFTIVERLHYRRLLVAVLILASVIWTGLSPFVFRAEPGRFYWLPFTGALYGVLLLQTKVMLLKVFLYGAPIYLLMKSGRPILWVTMGVGTLALLIEGMQTYIQGRTPESTDAFMALIIGTLLMVREHQITSRTANQTNSEPKGELRGDD